MWKTFLTLGFLSLAAFSWSQFVQVNRLSERLIVQEGKVRQLRATIDKSKDISAILNLFIKDNRRKIESLSPGKKLTVSAYSPREIETDDTPLETASNRPVRPGIVAVSRDLFGKGWVFGKRIYIQGQGIFTIDDLMAKDKRNQIDIFMYETDRALEFGKKTLEVVLLDV